MFFTFIMPQIGEMYNNLRIKTASTHPIESETCAWYIYERDALRAPNQAHVSQPTHRPKTDLL